MMRCEKYGSEFNGDHTACPVCGSPLSQAGDAQAAAAYAAPGMAEPPLGLKKEKWGKSFKTTCIILLVWSCCSILLNIAFVAYASPLIPDSAKILQASLCIPHLLAGIGYLLYSRDSDNGTFWLIGAIAAYVIFAVICAATGGSAMGLLVNGFLAVMTVRKALSGTADD